MSLCARRCSEKAKKSKYRLNTVRAEKVSGSDGGERPAGQRTPRIRAPLGRAFLRGVYNETIEKWDHGIQAS